MTRQRDVLGTGVGLPFDTDQRGGVGLAAGSDDVEQAIRILLSTAPGERVMRPEYGCGIHDLAFAVVDATTLTRVETTVRDAIDRWEPRVAVESVTASATDVAAGVIVGWASVALAARVGDDPVAGTVRRWRQRRSDATSK